MMKRLAWLTTAALLAFSTTAVADDPGRDLASHSVGAWGVDLSDQDRTVSPGDNFFMYENGTWFAHTELTPTRPIAAYWREVRRLAPARVLALLAETAQNRSIPPDSREGKAATLYRAFMDAGAVEARGLAPLQPELNAIRAAKTHAQMARLMGRMEGPGTFRAPSMFANVGRNPFTLAIGQDRRNPDRYAVFVGQGGLQLPGPEYYTDPKLADFKTAYQAHIAKLLTLIGWPQPEARAAEIVAFEDRVAAANWQREQLVDTSQTYNPTTVAELERTAPGFPWRAFFDGAELGGTQAVVIDAKTAFPKIAQVYAATPLDVLKARQAFAIADTNGPYLSAALAQASDDFRWRVIAGQALPGRAASADALLQVAVPAALGSLYVSRYSSPAVKAKVESMAQAIKTALDARIDHLEWMSPETRLKAHVKLSALRINIGYPDHFDDYRELKLSETDLYGDVSRASAYNWRAQVKQLGRPFDRSAWFGTPQYPNYYYLPATNTLEIPASLLEPPFFDLKADDAVNYGAIGVLMGQMLIIGFDYQGRHYDAQGRLADWWTADDTTRFAAMRDRLKSQYSAVEPLPGVHINGDLVVDEAVGDLGGLQIALDAYHASLAGNPAQVLDGYSGDQRFFLGRAQMWRAKFNVAFQRNQLATGANSPPFMRVNGTLPNLDAWYAAFGVKPDAKLYIAPEKRVHIW